MTQNSTTSFKKRFNTIRARLLLAFVLLVLFPAAGISVCSIIVGIQSGKQQAFERLESVAALKENEITTWLQNLQTDLLGLAEEDVYKKVVLLLSESEINDRAEIGKAEIYDRLVQVIELTKRFDEFFLLSKRGVVVLSTDPLKSGEFRGLQPYFKEGMQRAGIHLQSVSYSSASEKLNNVVVVHPFFDEQGNAVGVMCGQARFRTLNTIMGERTGLGSTGETYLVGSNSVLMTVSRSPGFNPGMSAIRTRAVEIALEKHENGHGLYRGYQGAQVIGVYRWLSELNSVLVAEQDQGEAFQLIYTTLFLNAIVAFFAVLLAGIASLYFARGIASPLADLARTATRIAQGNLELSAKVEGPDEICSAASSFNLMTERLRRRIDMEKLVSDMSRMFLDLSADEADLGISMALAEVATFVGSDRACIYLFSADGKTLYATHEWGAEGVEARRQREFRKDDLPWYYQRIENRESLHIPDIEFLPPEAEAEKTLWRNDGIKSLIRIPMFSGKNIRGLVGFDSVRETREWSGEDIQLFRMVGEIVYSTLERVWFEKTLASQKERLTVTLRSIGDGVITTDVEGRIILMNGVAEQLTGCTHEEAAGRQLGEIFNVIKKRSRARCPNPVEMVVQLGRVVSLEDDSVLIARDGTERVIANSGAPIREGDKIVGVVMVFRDVTEARQAEEERVRLATAIEQSAEAIFITDTNWIIHYVNPAFEQMTGYKRSEIIGRHTRFLKSDKHDESFYRLLRNTLMRGDVWSGRIINKKNDGTLYEAEVTSSPVRDKQGNILSYVSIHRDITNEVRLEKELRQAQKMEAIGRLAGGIAHDFNNILAAIMGFTEMAYSKIPDGSPARRNLEQVLKASSRAADLVGRILTFSRKTEVERKPVSLAPIIAEALRLLRSSLPTTVNISQDIDVSTEGGIVLADSTQIHQVLMNLCTNAAHAMREKGGTLSVKISEVQVDEYLVSRYPDLKPGPFVKLTIGDTGCGMDAQLIERIFDPYFTTKAAGEGSGMGLAVVQGIVKSHGGAISVYSEPGRGSSFNLFFPTIKGKVQQEAVTSLELPTGRERILFVDDERGLADLGEEMLQSLGYVVTAKTNSTEALELFNSQPDAFDLVITDMTMPGLTGKELASKLMETRCDIPVILCTGFSELINEKQAKDSGIRELLMKPYVRSNLAEAVRRALDADMRGRAHAKISPSYQVIH